MSENLTDIQKKIKKTQNKPKDYESAINELEAIVEKIERDEVSLHDAFDSFKRGVDLLAYCKSELEAVSDQFEQFKGLEDK